MMHVGRPETETEPGLVSERRIIRGGRPHHPGLAASSCLILVHRGISQSFYHDRQVVGAVPDGKTHENEGEDMQANQSSSSKCARIVPFALQEIESRKGYESWIRMLNLTFKWGGLLSEVDSISLWFQDRTRRTRAATCTVVRYGRPRRGNRELDSVTRPALRCLFESFRTSPIVPELPAPDLLIKRCCRLLASAAAG
eukprot:767149-Hanusia_phi.AAC.4